MFEVHLLVDGKDVWRSLRVIPDVELFYFDRFLKRENDEWLKYPDEVNNDAERPWEHRVRCALLPLFEVRQRLLDLDRYHHNRRPLPINQAAILKVLFRSLSEGESALDECKILVGPYHPFWDAAGNKESTLPITHLEEIDLYETLAKDEEETEEGTKKETKEDTKKKLDLKMKKKLAEQGIEDEDEQRAIIDIKEKLLDTRQNVLKHRKMFMDIGMPKSSDEASTNITSNDLSDSSSDSSSQAQDEFFFVGPPTERARNWLRSKARARESPDHPHPTLCSRQWFRTVTGRAWLRSEDGYKWLGISDSRRFLREPDSGHVFLSEPDGWEWLKSEGGREWLDTEDALLYLKSDNSDHWLKSSEGRAWWEPHKYNRPGWDVAEGKKADWFPEPSDEVKIRQTHRYLEDDRPQYFGPNFAYFSVNLGFKITFVRFRQRPLVDGQTPRDYTYIDEYESSDKGKTPVYTLEQR
ncbi:hypothetical protein PG996_008814 [Apiospora saccharicola]|uniref:Uncharacterized protein n=1 Tax=Apiospora saccharicola TaxID=335842 RepID=A0ABR1UZR1_9PEZI